MHFVEEKDKVTWAIIDCGHIAGKMAKAFAETDNANLYACASRSSQKAHSFASEYNIPHFFDTYQKALSAPNVDAVYIATPHPAHKDIAIQALQAGKAVLCEKPCAMNITELDEILKSARSSKKFFMEAMWTRFQPAFLQAMKYISDGRIGRLQNIYSDICTNNEYKNGSRLYEKELGGGAILDLGIYMITSAFSAISAGENINFSQVKPDDFSAVFRKAETGVDAYESIIFKYNDIIATLSAGIDSGCGNFTRQAKYIGTKGSVILDEFWYAQKVKLCDIHGKVIEELSLPFDANGYEYELRSA